MDADISAQANTRPIEVILEREDAFNPKPSMALRISAIVVPLITFCVQNWFVITVALIGAGIHSAQIAQMVGSLIGVFLFPVIVVGLFQIGKRFRNPRSRYRIFLFAALFSLFSSLFVRLVSFLAKAGSV
jgi:hypothetical protein